MMSLDDYMKVEQLKPNFRNVNLIVKVLNISSSRAFQSRRSGREHLIAEAFVGDETGSVLLTLWDNQINMFQVGDVLEIRGGYTSLFKGSLRLNVGRSGQIGKVEREIEEVNTRNNLSQTTYIQIPWRAGEGRPFRRRRKRR